MKTFISSLIALLLIGCSADKTPTLRESGSAEATEILISSKSSALVDVMRVREGEMIEQGDTLLQLDVTDILLQLRQADAALTAAEAEFALMSSGARAEDLKQAEVNYLAAKQDYERMEGLAENSHVSAKQRDDARNRFLLMEQQYQKVRSGARKEELQMSSARKSQALAQKQILEKKIKDATILSPISGTVTAMLIEKGELAMPGSHLLKIADLTRMRVTIYVPGPSLPYINVGQKVEVTADGLSDQMFEGRVAFISPMAEFTPKNVQTKEERTKLVYAVRIEVDNSKGLLKSGLPVDVVIPY